MGDRRVGTKQAVRQILDQLPDDCTMEQVLYHLYVVDAAQKGLRQADAGDVIPHEHVVAELRRKWQLGDVE